MNQHPFSDLQSRFVTGAVDAKGFPVASFPEVAFAGRSNVGKSSLLNHLLNRKNLARVSRTPGRTREINFFSVAERWMFVDLPGYGYAKVARDQRRSWDQVMDRYLGHRSALRVVVILLDLRRGMTDLDRGLTDLLAQKGIPWLPVATKIDKLKSNPRRMALRTLQEVVVRIPGYGLPPVVAVSSLTNEGMGLLWQRLVEILDTVPRDLE
ncbi:MAG: YihA family ribosome biogenesis GTP-binding protein [Magnetococcales bacterium]|nr:YihA family ribosome biogenesis GTP-binding protein [Magnetococcales bacterium]MBF0151132.1 YihA family ribosome biogenesis GTP-binding protein [Magnetococcales bacterium]MBF0174713.1 YihA family ribosome biogenesis GTP-binding protein [Magnetococcales bacterium]MBF0346788.1 YihA family ribosome biogenesis GTP-binding protein [Magnetococcales bacterium]MBF0630965.1 YihA family ribosome biogenesis GTP-binding protein [Magnetococcales bacterium]